MSNIDWAFLSAGDPIGSVTWKDFLATNFPSLAPSESFEENSLPTPPKFADPAEAIRWMQDNYPEAHGD